ncbi:hypothetical protein OsJ_06938 [Oryza sativa Japonica Group]|uniref:Uncharacterized protein n=1 Tax=Oryza sativa subsp. japonica TaxID=39947 RepID=B9F0A4_ORYSJ|nr:hypothetical protein OsJ_06938 [Oryza sativa Japonica Group]
MAGRASCVLILLLAIAGFADVLAAGGATPSSSSSQMFGCAFGCMAKGPDTRLCVFTCNQNSIVCMVLCALYAAAAQAQAHAAAARAHAQASRALAVAAAAQSRRPRRRWRPLGLDMYSSAHSTIPLQVLAPDTTL